MMRSRCKSVMRQLYWCRLRHIYVAERRSLDRADGPEDHQAAMAMGNSEAAWDASYDRMYQRREMQAGVNAMSVWRATMLEKAHAQARQAGLQSMLKMEGCNAEDIIDLDWCRWCARAVLLHYKFTDSNCWTLNTLQLQLWTNGW